MAPYRRITIAVGLAMLVDASLYLAVLPLLPHYADRFGLGTFEVAILLASFPLSAPFVSLGCIPLAVRVGPRRIALVAAAMTVAATVLVAFAPSAALLIVGRFLQGIASATVWTSSMAWVTNNAPDDRRGREAGIVMGLFSIGSVLGPGIGAAADAVGTVPAFLTVAAVGLVALGATVLAPAGAPIPPGDPLVPSLRLALGSPLARAALLMAVIDPLAFTAIDLLVPLDVADQGTSTTAIAGAIALGAALGGIAGPIGGRLVDRYGPPRIGLVAATAIALSPTALAFSPPPAVQLGVVVVLFPVFSVGTAAMYPLAALGADAAGVPHGAVNGLLGSLWAAGSATAAIAAGALAGSVGHAATFAITVALNVPLVAWLALDVRAGVRRGTRTPATPSR